jgi:arylsulfatase A-like enzyme
MNLRTIPSFAVLFSLAGLSTAAEESRPPEARPNILFCIADDVSYPHMGAYGCSWVKTPGFDRVAREGILFTNAYTPNAKCAPSRACIITGRNSWQLEEAANHVCYFPAKFKSYAEALAEHGYFVGHTNKGWGPGEAGEIDGRPRQLTGTPFNRRKANPPTAGISGNDYAANFDDFLAARPKDQPFCFWFGGVEPHRGYAFGSSLAQGGKKTADVPDVPDFWPDNETIRTDMLDYAFEIEHFDRHLERMLASLDEAGELDNTLVLVTADNGMPFPRCKGQTYEYSNHMPLAAMWKRGIKNPGRKVDDYVSFVDFTPTFLELAGVSQAESGMQAITGRSLTDIFSSDRAGRVNPARDHLLVGQERHDIGRPHDWGYPVRGIVKDGFLYLRNFEPSRWPTCNPETGYLNCDGSPTKTECIQARKDPETKKYWQWSFGKRGEEELYQISNDRDCLKNLADDPQWAEKKSQLKTQLLAELKEQGDPRMFGRGHVFDEYPFANPGQRGFYERFMGGEKMNAGWVNRSDLDPEAADEE